MLKKMELDTKITFMASIIPKLCLFVILGGGHIEFQVVIQVVWRLRAFLSVQVNRSYTKIWY